MINNNVTFVPSNKCRSRSFDKTAHFPYMLIVGCTTHRLSYIPNDYASLTPHESYAPIRKYQESDVPMESETTMRLSYQPVEANQIEKPWAAPLPYYPPVDPMEDNTTYNLRLVYRSCPSISRNPMVLTLHIYLFASYIPPGTLVPLCPPSCPPANTCESNFIHISLLRVKFLLSTINCTIDGYIF